MDKGDASQRAVNGSEIQCDSTWGNEIPLKRPSRPGIRTISRFIRNPLKGSLNN